MDILKLKFIAMLAAALLCTPSPSRAEQGSLQLYEQKIKAGMVYNFFKYTEWPAEKMAHPSSPLIACIFGQDPLDGYLQPMEGRTVKQRVIRIRNVYTVTDTAKCHLLFVSADKKASWPELHDFLVNKSVLTISDFPGFSATGGMIQFGNKNGRISVELNTDAMRTARLRVYDSMLKLVTVKGSADGPD